MATRSRNTWAVSDSAGRSESALLVTERSSGILWAMIIVLPKLLVSKLVQVKRCWKSSLPWWCALPMDSRSGGLLLHHCVSALLLYEKQLRLGYFCIEN